MDSIITAKFRKVSAGFNRNAAWWGWGLALISTLAFSIGSPIIKGAITGGMYPTALLVGRLLLTSLVMIVSIAIVAPQRLRMDRRGLLLCAIAGFGNGLGMICYFWALSKINASIASMIFALSPLAVLSLLALRGEKFTRRHIVRIALGLGGVYLLLGPGGTVDWLGVGLVCLTILFYAFHLSILQWYLKTYDASAVTLYVIIMMAITATLFWLFQGAPWQPPGWHGWTAMIVLALISTYLARLTMFAGIQRLGSGQIALLAPLETLLTISWSVLFLQEQLSMWQWLGGLLILTSALLAIERLNRAAWRPRWRVWPRP